MVTQILRFHFKQCDISENRCPAKNTPQKHVICDQWMDASCLALLLVQTWVHLTFRRRRRWQTLQICQLIVLQRRFRSGPEIGGAVGEKKAASHWHIRRPHATSRSSSIIDGCFNRVIKYAERRDETVLIYILVAGFSLWDGGTCWIWANQTETWSSGAVEPRGGYDKRTHSILWV